MTVTNVLVASFELARQDTPDPWQTDAYGSSIPGKQMRSSAESYDEVRSETLWKESERLMADSH